MDQELSQAQWESAVSPWERELELRRAAPDALGSWPPGWFDSIARLRSDETYALALPELLLWQPRATFLWYGLGQIQLKAGDPQRARRAFDVCLASGGSRYLWQHATLAQTRCGEHVRAIELARKAQASVPKFATPVYRLIRALVSSGRAEAAEEALELFEKSGIQAKIGNKGELWRVLARAHLILGDADGVKECEENAERSPTVR